MACSESQRELHVGSVRFLVASPEVFATSGGEVSLPYLITLRMRHTFTASSRGLEAHERVVDLREPT